MRKINILLKIVGRPVHPLSLLLQPGGSAFALDINADFTAQNWVNNVKNVCVAGGAVRRGLEPNLEFIGPLTNSQ